MNFMSPNKGFLGIVIPFYNEGPNLNAFARRLQRAFEGWNAVIYFVDDCSDDGFSPESGSSPGTSELDQVVIRNKQNQGHGPSVMKGIQIALTDGAEFVMTLDGDGNLDEVSLRESMDSLPPSGWDICIFSRSERNQEWFRRLVSKLLRALLFVKAGGTLPDANSPFRLYRRWVASMVIDSVGAKPRVPNVVSSILLLRNNVSIVHRVVRELNQGQISTGVTWQSRSKFLPSRRFIAFCLAALREVLIFRS